uniref:Uncharacterized protein n=1 Tax=viral metagenome TaxID=1070528 RepID=A0A6M3LVS6_9ZZZZ
MNIQKIISSYFQKREVDKADQQRYIEAVYPPMARFIFSDGKKSSGVVIKRTTKMVVIKMRDGKIIDRKLSRDHVEFFKAGVILM